MYKFLQKLQNSDEPTKRRWTFILSGAAIVIVIFIWLTYFNNLVTGLSAEPVPEPIAEESGFTHEPVPPGGTVRDSALRGFTFLQTLKQGTAVVFGTLADLVREFGEILGEPREYIISP